jgi:NAD(P)H-hydrate epimerase
MNNLPRISPRNPASHKGDFGRVLLIGGSRGMSGAIALAGMAATRSGAGLVTLAVPDACLETVACFDPCYMTMPIACDAEGRLAASAKSALLELTTSFTSVGLGPGLSRSTGLTQLVSEIYKRVTCPMVVDADALNALAERPAGLANPGGPRILTPHPGEFRRLVGTDLSLDESHDRARRLAEEFGVIVVLKGHQSLVTDGSQSYQNETGNPGMATGGAGDVLTGVIAALLGQGFTPLDAARLGVHVHGLAGDLACDDLGEVSLVASDILEYLPESFQELE